MKKCYVQYLDILNFCIPSHMEYCGQANFCTFIVANSILHNKKFKLAQLDLIQTHHVKSQAPIKASMYWKYILPTHLHETTVQKGVYMFQKNWVQNNTYFIFIIAFLLQHCFTWFIEGKCMGPKGVSTSKFPIKSYHVPLPRTISQSAPSKSICWNEMGSCTKP